MRLFKYLALCFFISIGYASYSLKLEEGKTFQSSRGLPLKLKCTYVRNSDYGTYTTHEKSFAVKNGKKHVGTITLVYTTNEPKIVLHHLNMNKNYEHEAIITALEIFNKMLPFGAFRAFSFGHSKKDTDRSNLCKSLKFRFVNEFTFSGSKNIWLDYTLPREDFVSYISKQVTAQQSASVETDASSVTK